MLDVFNSDVFGVVSLTEAINKLPFKPYRLGDLGIFSKKGVRTTSVVVEERHGILQLVPTSARNTNTQVSGGKVRQARSFICPHIGLEDAVMADDVQNMRAFGTESDIEAVNDLVNDKLADMRQSIEATHEWYRIGAIQGKVLDADGTTVIYDFFHEFGLTQQIYYFNFGQSSAQGLGSTDNVKLTSHAILRYMQDKLGATPFDGIHAMCDSNFFDELTTCAEVKTAYNRFQESLFLLTAQARRAFEYAGIMWEEYRGFVGTQQFIPPNTAVFFPTGAPGLFVENYAPAPFIETVNTTGVPVYAKQERMKWDRGVELIVDSNPLVLATRPQALVLGSFASGIGSPA
jgi:hypothetical protein